MEFVRLARGTAGTPHHRPRRQVVIVSAAMAVVLEHRNAPELAALRQGLKKPAPLHIKRNHMVSPGRARRGRGRLSGRGPRAAGPGGQGRPASLGSSAPDAFNAG